MKKLLTIIVVLIFSACNNYAPKKEIIQNKTKTVFNKNYLKWKAKNIKSYSFKLKRDCSCSKYPPILVTVKNNQITKVINLKNKKEFKNLEIAYTINQLYDFIKKSIDKNFDIKVIYDKKYFYPKIITLDKSSSMIITNFKVLK
jgi:hypothetical protein